MQNNYTSRALLTLLFSTFIGFLGGGNLLKAQIELTKTLVFTDFSSIGGTYNTQSSKALKDENETEYSGWRWSDCMTWKNNGTIRLQLKASTGTFTSPNIKSAAGYTVTITYGSTKALTLKIGEQTATGNTSSDATTCTASVSLTTDDTENTFTLSAGSKYALISKIEITPKDPSTNPPSTAYAAPTFDLAGGEYVIGHNLEQICLNMTSEEGTHIVYSVIKDGEDGEEITDESNSFEFAYLFPTIGKYTVKAKAVPADDSDEKGESDWTEAVYTIEENIVTPTQTDEETVIWKEDFSGRSSGSLSNTGENATYSCGEAKTKVYAENYAGGVSPELLISENGGSFTVTVLDLKGCSGKLKLSFKSNQGCWVYTTTPGCSVTDSIFDKTNKNTSRTITVPENTKSLVLTFKKTSSGNTRVDNFRLVKQPDPYYPFTISSVGLNTFAAHNSYVMPEGLEGGIVTVDETNMKANVDYKYQPGAVVPAGVALLLKGEAENEYQLTLTTKSGNTYPQNLLNSALRYGVFNAPEGQKYYIFANDKGNESENVPARGLGFYYQGLHHDGSSVKDIYGKGYLAVSGDAEVRGYALSEGEPTGIEIVEAANNDAAAGVYNLSGVRVATSTANLPAGFYIVNGKKVLVK